MKTIAERVARGAALLDEKLPGWWQRIDLEALTMRDTCMCILGQLFGNEEDRLEDDGYWQGLHDLNIPRFGAAHAAEYGFADEDPFAYEALDVEWCELIESRRAAS